MNKKFIFPFSNSTSDLDAELVIDLPFTGTQSQYISPGGDREATTTTNNLQNDFPTIWC